MSFLVVAAYIHTSNLHGMISLICTYLNYKYIEKVLAYVRFVAHAFNVPFIYISDTTTTTSSTEY